MKDLIVDIGNTRIKVAVYEQGKLLSIDVLDKSELADFFLSVENVGRKFYSSVGDSDGEVEKLLREKFDFTALSRKMKMPFTNSYKSKETLGLDRLALAAAAVKCYPNKNVLVIDAGTCITYDLVESDGSYQGGAISPGIEMRYKAMNHYTAGLPLLNVKPVNELLGKTTPECMHIGVEKGVVFEIDSMLDAYNQQYDNLTVVLTGGDTFHLEGQLKNTIFANPNFVLEGLECIMTYNI